MYVLLQIAIRTEELSNRETQVLGCVRLEWKPTATQHSWDAVRYFCL